MADATTTARSTSSAAIPQLPIVVIVKLLVLGAAWVFFSQLQITATEQGVLGLLNIGTTLIPGMTAHQAVDFINGSLDKWQTISTAIGWGVQLYILMIAFPANYVMHPHLAKGKKFITGFLIGADILTDFLYVVSGHNLFPTMLWIIPTSMSPGAPGVILVAAFYPAVICGVTIWCAIELAHSIHALFDMVGSFTKKA